MLMIRFQRIGRTNDPAFRIAVMEKERAAKTGSIVELLGTYNPRSKALTLDESRVKEWLSKGAQPTDSIRNLLINKGVIKGKKVNALPKKTSLKPAETAGSGERPAEQAAVAAETEAPAAPTEAEVVAEAEPAAAEPTAADVSPEASAKEGEKPAS